MVLSLALRPDDTKQDPVVYGTKFGVVFLAEGPCTASIQKGFDCFGLYHPGLEREHNKSGGLTSACTAFVSLDNYLDDYRTG